MAGLVQFNKSYRKKRKDPKSQKFVFLFFPLRPCDVAALRLNVVRLHTQLLKRLWRNQNSILESRFGVKFLVCFFVFDTLDLGVLGSFARTSRDLR